jgi:choline dehydrogenase
MPEFDYVIVGGGTAGCVLAARLSDDPSTSVALIEAGPAHGSDATADPLGFPQRVLGGELDWSYRTIPQRAADDRIDVWPGGRVLGGSSAINAMGHLREHAAGYDAWGEGWRYADLLPYFQRSETAPGRDPSVRGTGGPMQVRAPEVRSAGAWAFFDAVVEAGYGFTDDISGTRQEGAFWYEMNVVDGRRQSAADAYLSPVLDRPNLAIIAEATAHRLTIDRGRCSGVAYAAADGVHEAHAHREVVVSAGTIGSPQLLMLSGVGPADHLRAVGVAVTADLPGVGANLHDHVQSRLSYDSSQPMGDRTGGPVGAMVRTSPSLSHPDIQLLMLDSGYPLSFAVHYPHSRGTVRLASADPAARPLIDPAYLTDERDVQALLAGLRVAREVAAAPSMSTWVRAETLPGDGDARAHMRATAGTYFHPIGTCAIDSVVDRDLTVRGVDGLRVVDASVMPSHIGANVNATVLAIAERAADLIKRSATSSGS